MGCNRFAYVGMLSTDFWVRDSETKQVLRHQALMELMLSAYLVKSVA